MKLHYHPVSPYSRKVLVSAYHRRDQGQRVPLDLKILDVNGGALLTPSFRELSPFGKMPVLETSLGPIIESTSIVDYLEQVGERVMLPRDCEREARHFDRIADLYLLDPQAAIFFHPESSQAKVAWEYVTHAWQLFQTHLADRLFVCGDHFTLGDVGASLATHYLDLLGFQVPEPLREWKARCMEVPAMARSEAEALPTLTLMIEQRQREIDQRRAWSSL